MTARPGKLLLEKWRDGEMTSLNSAVRGKRSSAGLRKGFIPVEVIEKLEPERILLFRTLQISLVQMGRLQEASNYIASCIESKILDAQNRGFHLEYYGDIKYDPTQPLINRDALGPCTGTLRKLGGKFSEAIGKNEPYPLMDIEIYTVVSLLQRRLESRKLSSEDRALGIAILGQDRVATENQLLLRLLDRVREDLSNANFHPTDIVADLFRMKKLQRAGWTAKGRQVKNAESVASHTFGGMTLMELFLPETSSVDGSRMGDGYSKERCLRIFLKHDWAESYIGDLLPDARTDLSAESEDRAFSHLDVASTYAPFAISHVYEDWLEFERGASTNAKIARDFDQLDVLQQILVERKIGGNVIPDEQSWINSIKGKLKSTIGASVFAFLVEQNGGGIKLT